MLPQPKRPGDVELPAQFGQRLLHILVAAVIGALSLDAVLFDDSPSCVTKKSRFLKMLMYQLFSVVPFGVAKKIRRT
jgi:hypothetical protein